MRRPQFHIRTLMIVVVVVAILSSVVPPVYNILFVPSDSDSDVPIRFLLVCCPLTLIGMMGLAYWMVQFLRGK